MEMPKNLSYGAALEVVKAGGMIARSGWNGKGMFVFMRPEDKLSVEMIVDRVKSLPQSVKDYYCAQHSWTVDERENGKSPSDTFVKFTAYLCMKAADGSIVNGWLASQTDMLSNDWEVVG